MTEQSSKGVSSNPEESNGSSDLGRSDRYLCFQLGTSHYAIPLLAVREIVELTELTPVPGSPTHFEGVMNLRGQIVGVGDLRKKLKLPAQPKTTKTAVVILDTRTSSAYGVIVDRVTSVREFAERDFTDTPKSLKNAGAQFLIGVARCEDQLVLVIDWTKVFTEEEVKSMKDRSLQKAHSRIDVA